MPAEFSRQISQMPQDKPLATVAKNRYNRREFITTAARAAAAGLFRPSLGTENQGCVVVVTCPLIPFNMIHRSCQ